MPLLLKILHFNFNFSKIDKIPFGGYAGLYYNDKEYPNCLTVAKALCEIDFLDCVDYKDAYYGLYIIRENSIEILSKLENKSYFRKFLSKIKAKIKIGS
jgi:hypothetical protein